MLKCRLFDKNNNEWIDYKEPIYTKINSIYGYLTVSDMNTYFFYVDSENVCYDDFSDRFSVEYVIF